MNIEIQQMSDDTLLDEFEKNIQEYYVIGRDYDELYNELILRLSKNNIEEYKKKLIEEISKIQDGDLCCDERLQQAVDLITTI